MIYLLFTFDAKNGNYPSIDELKDQDFYKQIVAKVESGFLIGLKNEDLGNKFRTELKDIINELNNLYPVGQFYRYAILCDNVDCNVNEENVEKTRGNIIDEILFTYDLVELEKDERLIIDKKIERIISNSSFKKPNSTTILIDPSKNFNIYDLTGITPKMNYIFGYTFPNPYNNEIALFSDIKEPLNDNFSDKINQE